MTVTTAQTWWGGGAPRPPPPVRGGGARRPGDAGAGYLFLLPWIIGMLLLTLGPMLASLYLSFTRYDLFTSPQWIGLDNYRRMLEDARFLQAVQVTGMYVLLAVPLKLGAALGVAVLLNNRRRGSGFYRAAFYGPSLIGASVGVAIVWRTLFAGDGVVDRLLSTLGIDTGGWVGNPTYSLPLLVLLATWQFGAPMVIFLAGLQQVPQEVLEAAAVDGAGRVRRFWRVTLPMISPVIFFNLVLETIGAFQVFTSAYVIATGTAGEGGPAGSTLVYTVYLYNQGFGDMRMGYASAMAWVLLIVAGGITLLLFRTARGWVHYAGDKR